MPCIKQVNKVTAKLELQDVCKLDYFSFPKGLLKDSSVNILNIFKGA